MANKDLKSALGASLKAEESSVKNRFEKAEQVLDSQKKRAPRSSSTTKKTKKSKVVRDSFTLPAEDYALIETLKERCLGLKLSINKSEAIRAGLKSLNKLSDTELTKIVKGLTKVKTGRPAKD